MTTKTNVSSVAMHLAKAPSKPLAAVAMSAIFTKDDLVDSIFTHYASSLSGKMKAAIEYAEDTYTLGLPGGQITQFNSATPAEVKAAILADTAYPYDIVMAGYKYVTYAPYYEIMGFLLTERKINTTSNTIHAYPGLSFDNGQMMYITGGILSPDTLSVIMTYAYYGNVPTTYNDDTNSYTYYTWTHLGDYTETILRPDTTNVIFDDNCLFARYIKLDVNGQQISDTNFWVYHIYTNTYPGLDNRVPTSTPDKYFPVVPLRYNNVDLTGEGDSAAAIATRATPLFQTSKRLLKILGMPFETLGENINANPSIGQIDHAYVMFGADLQSNEIATIAYLNHYFDYLSTLSTTVYGVIPLKGEFGSINQVSPNSSFTEYGLSLDISFDSIVTTIIPGKVDNGRVGNARKTVSFVHIPASYTQGEGDTQIGYEAHNDWTLTLDLQITDSAIRRVTVQNPTLNNYIYGSFAVTTTLENVHNDPDNHNFIIPLEYNISLWLLPKQRNQLYIDCSLLVINAVERKKLEWYQEGWFSFVVIVVVVIIAYFTMQPYLAKLGPAYSAAVAAALEAGATATAAAVAGVLAVMKILVMQLLIGALISVAAKWAVRKYGAKLGIAGATVIAIVALAASGGKYGFNYQLLGQYTLQYSQLALASSMALIEASNESIMASAKAFGEEYAAFTDLLKAAEKELETNTEVKALSFDDQLDLFAVTKAKEYYSIPNEYASDFFERTLNLPYNNVYGIHGAVENFVDNLLTIDNNTVMSAY